LHDLLVADKRLVVKVDAKTKDVLDNFKKQRRLNATGGENNADGGAGNEDDYIDASMKHIDSMASESIQVGQR
jgi:hypothetical protein